MKKIFFAVCFIMSSFAFFGKAAAADILIHSSYVERANVYKGQTHCHSKCVGGCSDGQQPPAEVAAAYRDAGYDFVSITDHNTITPIPSVSGILIIPGIEDTMANGHLNRINATKPTVNTLQGVINLASQEGSFVVLNHPNFNLTWTDEKLNSVSGYHGIEVWNSIVAAANQNVEERIDRLLSEGKKFYLVATDDCHNITGAYCKTASVRVFADKLTKQDIMSNLVAGNFYASNGADILKIGLSGQAINVVTNKPSKIEFIAKDGIIRQANTSVTIADYMPRGDEKYVRVRVTRDSDSRMAWSNPFYVIASPVASKIFFVEPTPADNAVIYNNTATIRTESKEDAVLLDWNKSLIGWWRFNGESGESAALFKDWSTYGNNGSCAGDKCPAPISGKLGGALRFDGNDCISTNAKFGDNLPALTVSAWVYPTAGGYALSFVAKDDFSKRSWYFGLNDNETFKVALWTNAGRFDLIAGGLKLNEWANLAFTYNGSEIKLYKNGVVAASKPASGILIKTDATVRIGCINNNYNFKGLIDDVRIYSRALSVEEIKSGYDGSQNQLAAIFNQFNPGSYIFRAYAQNIYGNSAATELRTIAVANPVCVSGVADGCRVCKSDGSGWFDDNAKCAAGQICQSGSCVSTCVPNCDQAGDRQCSGNGYQICETINGCRQWGTVVACAANQTCSNGQCSSGCIPTNCQAAGFQCGSIDDGCGNMLNCGTCVGGKTCNATGQCVPQTTVESEQRQQIQQEKLTRTEIIAKIAEVKKLLIQLIIQLIAELQKQLAALK